MAGGRRSSPGSLIAIPDGHVTARRHSADVGSLRYTNEVVLRDQRFDLVDVVESLTVLRRRP